MQPSRLPHTNKLWRKAIIKESNTFLDKYGLDNAVHQTALKMVAGGAPIVRISHQPNLFASLNIMGLFIWAAQVAEQLGGVVVFVAVDYDEASDQRFRAALLPPVSGEHAAYLKGAVTCNDRSRVAYAVSPPSPEIITRWLSTHRQALRHTARTIGKKVKRINIAETIYEDTLRSVSLTEFNLVQIARVSQLLSDSPVLFISASQYLGPLQHHINRLVSDLLYSGHDPQKIVLRICPRCNHRCATTVSKQLIAIWSCARCDIVTTEPLDWSKLVSNHLPKPVFIPRVLLCDLIDSRLLGNEASISYGSSATHLLLAHETQAKYGVPQEVIDLLWSPRDLNFVPQTFPNADLWNRGRFSSYSYLALFDVWDIRSKVLHVPPIPLTDFSVAKVGF